MVLKPMVVVEQEKGAMMAEAGEGAAAVAVGVCQARKQAVAAAVVAASLVVWCCTLV